MMIHNFLKRNSFLVLASGLFFFCPFLLRASSPDIQNGINTIDAGEAVKTEIYLFEREGCGFCDKEKDFLTDLLNERDDFNLTLVDIDQEENRRQFETLTEQYALPKVTPTTIIGNFLIQGFDSPETTGAQIISFIEQSKGQNQISSTTVAIIPQQNFVFKVPLLGVVNAKDFSLFSLSVILGLVDGFNPCAMWVLMTFLLILWQIKDRKKMFQVVGIFIIAEAIMYWLILNVWYRAWDFIALDKIITPIVGVVAIGGGIYFLTRYFKNRGKLVCDTDISKQSKTEGKIKKLVNGPMTILTALGIIGVAFSVNIIEFACSIGIAQAFTKILEINVLTVFAKQFYIALYTLFYMVDDFIIFGLALYGFSKFYTVGQKYSNLSSLIGGILMIILGALLIFAPGLLVF
ncbi:MAG: glutaredoxin family protein [Patescibacteria group bacterium]